MDDATVGKVKLPPLAQVGVVVKDIDKVITFYSSTFGIGPWEVREGQSEATVKEKIYRYKTKVAFTQLGPITLELFQVREGASPVHAYFRDKDREGVHHLGFYVTKEERERIIVNLAKMGVGVFQTSKIRNQGTATFLDTEQVGGIFFELIERHTER
jgi:catechol 2,3-dioxygenase-like lactoylglutathione lyase family enzyme